MYCYSGFDFVLLLVLWFWILPCYWYLLITWPFANSFGPRFFNSVLDLFASLHFHLHLLTVSWNKSKFCYFRFNNWMTILDSRDWKFCSFKHEPIEWKRSNYWIRQLKHWLSEQERRKSQPWLKRFTETRSGAQTEQTLFTEFMGDEWTCKPRLNLNERIDQVGWMSNELFFFLYFGLQFCGLKLSCKQWLMNQAMNHDTYLFTWVMHSKMFK